MGFKSLNVIRQGLGKLRYASESSRFSQQFKSACANVDGAEAYAHLQTFSLAFSAVRTNDGLKRSVNLVLPELSPNGIFAGIRTALEFAIKLALRLDRPLRIVALRGDMSPVAKDKISGYISKEFDLPLGRFALHVSSEMPGFSVNRDDYWIATYWTTAHALDVATRLNILNAKNIVYLVQDYEPGFFAWSTDFALARSTYQAQFHQVVNSSPLARYLQDVENIFTPSDYVFAPSLDMKRLENAADKKTRSSIPRVLFYARPSKPRNLYVIGLSALHLVAAELKKRNAEAVFLSAGEVHEDVQLSTQHVLVSRGKLAWDEYFNVLSNTDIVLSLQHSPHPSHPPLDAVTAGCIAVTNELGGTRAGLHRNLLVAEPDPVALAQAILQAVAKVSAMEPQPFDGDFCSQFGQPMPVVVDTLARKLQGSHAPAVVRTAIDGMAVS
jgi:hypothetical protein